MQRGMKRNMKAYRQPFNHSLCYYKLEPFSFIMCPHGVLSSFHGGEKQGEGKRDSVFLARILRNEIKKWSSNEKVLVIKSEATYGSGQ